jgi:hypothetical protein
MPRARARLPRRLEEPIRERAKANHGTRRDIPQISAESFKPIETHEEIAKLAGGGKELGHPRGSADFIARFPLGFSFS